MKPREWSALWAMVAVVSGSPALGFADPVCGKTPTGLTGWNVPSGAVVFTQSPGPVKDVIAGVGEYRSHSMLSHGPGGWVTHSAAITPIVSSDRGFCGSECANPLDANFLHNSMPGQETVTQGAIYTYLYGALGTNFIAYQNGGGGANQSALGNVIWSSNFSASGFGWWDWGSATDGSQEVYGIAYKGSKIHYGWNQYMNSQSTPHGAPGLDTGTICSSSLSMWQHVALNGQSGYTGDIAPRTYPKNLVSAAANDLFNSVHTECEQQDGFFASASAALTQIGMLGLCGTCGAMCWWSSSEMGSYDGDPCDEVADQMVNAFVENGETYPSDDCNYDLEYRWHSLASSSTSTTVSPDDVGCWNGNGTGAPCSGAGSSIWGYDGNETVQWNSGGTLYSCWD